MSKIYLLIAIFTCFSCNNRTNNWINQEEGTGLLNIWKYETTKVFLDKTQYCYDNKKISFTDLDGILFALVQIPDYDLKELFKLSMKHKWDKMYLIYHEFEGSKYDIVATILLYLRFK